VKRHVIIPDTQVKPGVETSHIDWAAQAIVEYKPDVVVVLGDWWDFASLNGHEEKGSAGMENSRYQDDLDVGNDAFRRLCAPMNAEIERLRKGKRKLWTPRKVFLRGNHEDRADRVARNDPKWTGVIGSHNCETLDFEVHGFLDRVWIDGIIYSHYFKAPNSSRPVGGSIDARLNRIGDSFVQGHQQGFLYGNRVYPTGKIRHGLVAGSFYQHDESYKGPQDNDHFRGIVVLNEVNDGDYCIMPLTLEYLRRRFS
jgi:hypothetical protein